MITLGQSLFLELKSFDNYIFLEANLKVLLYLDSVINPARTPEPAINP